MVSKGTWHKTSTQNLRVFGRFWVLVTLTSTLNPICPVLRYPYEKQFFSTEYPSNTIHFPDKKPYSGDFQSKKSYFGKKWPKIDQNCEKKRGFYYYRHCFSSEWSISINKIPLWFWNSEYWLWKIPLKCRQMDTDIPLNFSEIQYLLLETIPLETIMRVMVFLIFWLTIPPKFAWKREDMKSNFVAEKGLVTRKIMFHLKTRGFSWKNSSFLASKLNDMVTAHPITSKKC